MLISKSFINGHRERSVSSMRSLGDRDADTRRGKECHGRERERESVAESRSVVCTAAIH